MADQIKSKTNLHDKTHQVLYKVKYLGNTIGTKAYHDKRIAININVIGHLSMAPQVKRKQ